METRQSADLHVISDTSMLGGLSDEQLEILFRSLAQGKSGEERVSKGTFVSCFPGSLQNLVSPLFLQIAGATNVDNDSDSLNDLSIAWALFAHGMSRLLKEGISWATIFQNFHGTEAPYMHGLVDRPAAEWALELSFWFSHQHLTPAGACEIVFDPGSIGMGADWATGCITEIPNGSQAARKGVKLAWKMVLVDGLPYTEELLDNKLAGRVPYTVTFQMPDPFAAALEAVKRADVDDDWCEYNLPCVLQSLGAQVGQCLLGTPCQEGFLEIESRILDAGLRFLLSSMESNLWLSGVWDPLYRDWCDGRSFHSLMKNAQHYRGLGVIVIRGGGGEVIGAISDYWEDGTGQFGGSPECFIFSLQPAIQVCRAKENCKNYAYLNLKNKQKPVGLGFGGNVGSFRLWIDSDLSACQVSRMDPTYGAGRLYCEDAPYKTFKITRLEIWGFGGDDARSSQLLQQKRDQDIRDQARKVDRSLLVESQFDKEMFFSSTFAATASAREPKENT